MCKDRYEKTSYMCPKCGANVILDIDMYSGIASGYCNNCKTPIELDWFDEDELVRLTYKDKEEN